MDISRPIISHRGLLRSSIGSSELADSMFMLDIFCHSQAQMEGRAIKVRDKEMDTLIA